MLCLQSALLSEVAKKVNSYCFNQMFSRPNLTTHGKQDINPSLLRTIIPGVIMIPPKRICQSHRGILEVKELHGDTQ